jgi:hypothetical protein
MKNAGLIFLMSIWAIVYANSAIGAFSDARLATQKTTEVGTHIVEQLGQNYHIQSPATQPNSVDFNTQASALDAEDNLITDNHQQQNDFSVSPYWFYAFKIIILLAVLAWDTKSKESAERKQ